LDSTPQRISAEPEHTPQARSVYGHGEYIQPGHRTYRLTLCYRGTEFHGWQRQPQHPSIQSHIEAALEKCWGHPVVLQGSGRTDTGVHALAQVAHFREIPKIPPANMVAALNNNLPEGIRILKVAFAPPSFHARFSATGKEYHYHILNQAIADPFKLDLAWHIRLPLDLEAIRSTFPMLTGTHDFASYTSNPGYERETTVRTITGIHLKKKGSELVLVFRGEGFLYRMVRNLVGAMVKVGQHRIQPGDIETILKARKRSEAPPTAPAHGLYLARVFYGKVPG